VSGGFLTEELESRWRTDGWCVIESAFSGDELARAQEAVWSLFPTPDEMDSGVDNERTAPWRTSDAPWPEFPFDSEALNHLVVHEALIETAQELLETTDVRLYQGTLTAKYSHQSSGYNQLLHTDYPNHSILVPRGDAGYQQLETYIYLNDVSTANGATRMVSRRLTADIPVERHTLRLDDYAALYDDPGEATGPTGSVVVPSRRLPPVGRPDRAGGFPVHAPCGLQARRCRVGWIPGMALQRAVGRLVQLRPGRQRPSADGGGLSETGSPVLDGADPGRGPGAVSGARHGSLETVLTVLMGSPTQP
jgi:hypothetical protein